MSELEKAEEQEFEEGAINAIRQINLMIVAQEYEPGPEFCRALADLNGACARHFNPRVEPSPEGEDAEIQVEWEEDYA